MSKNREIEAKTLLSEKVYRHLCAAFPKKADFKQANYYFDTPAGNLRKKSIGLRIRIFADRAEQTMKVPDTRPVQKKFHEVIEINDKLTLNQAHFLLKAAQNKKAVVFAGNIGQYFQKHFPNLASRLQLITWSKTHRILANGPQNCELTFDATSYPDGAQDYELEIENTNPALIKKVQMQLEEEYDFRQTAINTNQNKIARAMRHR